MTHILHLADIHIGSGKRSAEYRKVFDTLRQKIDTFPKNYKLIVVIAGDIFHDKIKYSGTDVADFKYLLEQLQNVQVVIIPGNHDLNMRNMDELDLLSPLITGPNVTYMRKCGWYTVCGVEFYHISVYNKHTTSSLEALTDSDRFRNAVVLYHGIVDGVSFGGHIERNRLISLKVINNSKLFLLGDIHEHQFITPTCAYSGSLIQQNFGESENKGGVLWDLKTNKGTFIRLENEIVMLDFNLSEMTDVEVAKKMKDNENAIYKIRAFTDGTNDDDRIKMIEDVYGRKLDKRIDVQHRHVLNIADDMYESLAQILQESGATDKQIGDILDYQKQRTVDVKPAKWHVTKLTWKNLFKYGDQENVIEFDTLAGLSGVVADNRAGKSSIIDILVFALYGEHLRADKRSMINKHANKSFVRVEFSVDDKRYYLEREDDRYKHSEIAFCVENIDKDGVSTWIPLTADSTRSTHTKVKSIIGGLNSFLTTGLYYDASHEIIKQNRGGRMKVLSELFGLGNNEQIIKDLKNEIASIKKQIAGLIKPSVVNPDQTHAEKLAELDALHKKQVILSRDTKRLAELTTIFITQTEKYKSQQVGKKRALGLKAEITKLSAELDTIKPTEQVEYAQSITINKPQLVKLAAQKTRDIDTIKAEIAAIAPITAINVKKLKTQKKTLLTKRQKLSTGMPNVEQCDYDYDEVNTELSAIDSDLAKLKDLPSNSVYVKALSDRKADLESKSALTFNPKCKCCNNNKLRLDNDLADCETKYEAALRDQKIAVTTNSKNETERVKLGKQRELTRNKFQLLSNKERAASLELQIATIDKDLEAINTGIETYNAQRDDLAKLTKLNVELATAEKVASAITSLDLKYKYDQYLLCVRQKELRSQIEQRQHTLEILDVGEDIERPEDPTEIYELAKSNLQTNTNKISVLKRDIEVLEKEMELLTVYDNEFAKLDEKRKTHEIHLNALGNTGLKLKVVNKNIDKIINHANEILQTVTDFTISHTTDDKNMDINILEDGQVLPIGLGSGFQKFVVSLAIRLAMTIMLPTTSSFIMIDEGFGCMDSTNLSKLSELFLEIKQTYKFVFIISHIAELQNLLDQQLHIFTDKTSYIHSKLVRPELDEVAVEEWVNDANRVEEFTVLENNKVKCRCGRVMVKSSYRTHIKSTVHKKRMDKNV